MCAGPNCDVHTGHTYHWTWAPSLEAAGSAALRPASRAVELVATGTEGGSETTDEVTAVKIQQAGYISLY